VTNNKYFYGIFLSVGTVKTVLTDFRSVLNGCVNQKAAQDPTITRLAIIIIKKRKFILVHIKTIQFQNYEILYLKIINKLGFKK
jgi:hypothetical protein